MKALDIIDALTRMGSTEGTGIVETPDNPNEIPNWITSWFGGGCDEIKYDETLKPSTKYIYVYDETITPKAVADCKVEVSIEYSDGKNTWTDTTEIYLHEIE